MANVKITDLQLVDAIEDALNFPVDDTLQTYRATIGQVKNYFAPIYVPPSVQRFTSGSGTYNKGYTFFGSAIGASVGATYTHNSITYTVVATVSGSTQIVLSGSAPPLASGTLTKASGTGDTTITFTSFRAPIYLVVEMVGGGGGGGGSGTALGNTGTAGGSSTFGTSLLTCPGGAAGTRGGLTGTSSSPTVNSPAIALVAVAGGEGGGSALMGSVVSTGSTYATGGNGGSSFYGGAPGISDTTSAGRGAATNSGSGGSGAGAQYASSHATGGGGGSGAFIRAIINNPSNTYAYAVGAAGSGSAAGTSGSAGGNGAAGIIIVTEHYQ